MKIERIEYRQLKTFGNYENETVGATAVLEDGESPSDALADLKQWVRNELAMSISGRETRQQTRYEIESQQRELDALNESIETAKAKWDKAKAFLEKHGLQVDLYEAMPF